MRGAHLRGVRRALLSAVLFLPACRSAAPEAIQLTVVSTEAISGNAAETIHELIFEEPGGSHVRAFLRAPLQADTARRELYGIVLIAGRETGREAAAMVPGPLDGLVLAVEYLDDIPGALEAGDLLKELPRVRRAAARMPGVLLGMADFLVEHPAVDPERLALVGVSFGVPFAAPAGRDPRFSGVALLYGGADLALLFRTHLPVRNTLLRGATARLLALTFRAVEPARHVGHISPTPLLLINGTDDGYVPRESALRLAAEAQPPVRHIWLPRGHLMPWPEYFPLMRELADSTVSHFEFLR